MTEPQTPFEVAVAGGNDNPAWTTLAQEVTYLTDLAAWSPYISVDFNQAQSAGSRQIHLVRLGYPEPPAIEEMRNTLFVLGGVHGNEQAGREAIFPWLRDLVSSPSILGSINVAVVCTVNPDGVAGDKRFNDADADINRTWLELNQPESFYTAGVIAAANVRTILDLHEMQPRDELMTYQGTVNPDAAAAIRNLAHEFNQALIDNSNALNRLSAFWVPATGVDPEDPRMCHNCFGLTHYLTAIFESNRSQSNKERMLSHAEGLAFAWPWHQANLHKIIRTRKAARRAVVHEGLTRGRLFEMVEGTPTIPPVSYSMTTSELNQAASKLNIHGILSANLASGDGVQVRLGQVNQPIAPYLLDSESAFVIATTTKEATLLPDLRHYRSLGING